MIFMRVSICVSLLHLQCCLIEERDKLSSQQHNHLFSQELYKEKFREEDKRDVFHKAECLFRNEQNLEPSTAETLRNLKHVNSYI